MESTTRSLIISAICLLILGGCAELAPILEEEIDRYQQEKDKGKEEKKPTPTPEVVIPPVVVTPTPQPTHDPILQPTPEPVPQPSPIPEKPAGAIADYDDHGEPAVYVKELLCGDKELRFDGRKDDVNLLVLLSHTQKRYKVLTPRVCGSLKSISVRTYDGKICTGNHCGLANGGRAHYCFSSGCPKSMPQEIIAGSKAIKVPASCKKKDRCE